MKPTLHAVVAPPNTGSAHAVAQSSTRVADFMALTKPRLNLLVLLTTLGGLYLAPHEDVALALILHTVVGTALVASGAAALNQIHERQLDAMMERTANRPMPQGRIPIAQANLVAYGLTTAGLLLLFFFLSKLIYVIIAMF